jgi:hypothetical protein
VTHNGACDPILTARSVDPHRSARRVLSYAKTSLGTVRRRPESLIDELSLERRIASRLHPATTRRDVLTRSASLDACLVGQCQLLETARKSIRLAGGCRHCGRLLARWIDARTLTIEAAAE